MREDVYVENDSGGMSILSSSVVDRVIADDRRNDEAFAGAHEAILVALEGDDSFIARVVVGEPLTREEEAQWICRIRTRLAVPCGRLLVCGGFDPRCLADFREQGPMGYVHEVRVPPGEYLADVYTHLPTMSARFLRESWDEKIGTWFRREHPGEAFPSWLAAELASFPEEDPGHQKEWAKLKRSVASGTLRVDTASLDWVGYLVHLRPLDAEAELSSSDGGWFPSDCGFRRPSRFPLGLPAVGAEGPEVRGGLEEILPRAPKAKPAPPPAEDAAPVLGLLPEPLPIEGGAVAVPVEGIDAVARIAWFCDREIDAAATVALPAGAKWAPRCRPDTPAIVSAEGNRLQIGFPESGMQTLSWTGDLARSLGKLPDGAVLELCFARTGSPEVTSGNHRWRGAIGAGHWSLTHAWPAVPREAVEQALALVDELGRGEGIRTRDEAEADALVQAAAQDEYLSQAEVVRRGPLLTIARHKGAYLPYLARLVFRRRLCGAWDLSSDEAESEELRQIMSDAFAAITQALTPAVTALTIAQATGEYRRAQLGRRKDVDQGRLADFDARFLAIGLRPLGDLVFAFASEIAVRAYGGEGAGVYGSLMWPTTGEPQVDLYTRFSDGSSLTTTTSPWVEAADTGPILRSSFPGEAVEGLWRRHREATARRLATGASALPAEPTVEAFAQAVDEFLQRERAALRG